MGEIVSTVFKTHDTPDLQQTGRPWSSEHDSPSLPPSSCAPRRFSPGRPVVVFLLCCFRPSYSSPVPFHQSREAPAGSIGKNITVDLGSSYCTSWIFHSIVHETVFDCILLQVLPPLIDEEAFLLFLVWICSWRGSNSLPFRVCKLAARPAEICRQCFCIPDRLLTAYFWLIRHA